MRRKIEDEREARRCLKAAAAAGLSTGEWAREHGIDGRSLNAWRINLSRSTNEREVQPLRLVELVPAAVERGDARYLVRVGDVAIELGLRRRDARSPRSSVALVLSLPTTLRVFVAVEPIDMRGSFDALAGAVRRLGLDPVDGHLYLFLNKRRRIAKALWFDGSGWYVLAKRLEAGSFQLPPLETAENRVQIDGAAFASLLAGIDFTASRKGWFRGLAKR